MPFSRRGFFGAFLANVALSGRRLFHLGAHGTEIIRGRNDGEEDDQYAAEGEQALESS